MPKARSKKLLILAIASTTLTTVLVAAWSVSVFWLVQRWDSDGPDPHFKVTALGWGAFAFTWVPANKARGPIVRGEWTIDRGDTDLDWWPYSTAYGTARIITIPLWIPSGLALAASAAAWHFELRSRSRARAGLCPTCRYDLAATPAGAPCPECGTPTSTAPPTPAA